MDLRQFAKKLAMDPDQSKSVRAYQIATARFLARDGHVGKEQLRKACIELKIYMADHFCSYMKGFRRTGKGWSIPPETRTETRKPQRVTNFIGKPDTLILAEGDYDRAVEALSKAKAAVTIARWKLIDAIWTKEAAEWRAGQKIWLDGMGKECKYDTLTEDHLAHILAMIRGQRPDHPALPGLLAERERRNPKERRLELE